jgi:two-component system sensor histidine kinase AtoS
MAVDHLPVGLLVIDREGQVRVFNRALSRLTGLKNDTVLGRLFLKVLDGHRPDLNKLLQTLATGGEFQELNPEAVVPVIGSTAFAASTYAIRDKSGVTIGAMAVFIPVGRQQELENAVIKAEKLAILGQLAAGMVHEIRNPLTAVGGFLQLLQKSLKGTPKEEYIPIMLAELKHVNRLIAEFLQLAKPGSSKRTSCSITKIMTEVLMLVESEAFLRKVDIINETSIDISSISGDDKQLKQVFLNIIKNAFDALSDGGKLFLQTSWDMHEGFVRVAIRDTGAGMDEQTVTNLFDPFFTTKESGTGLGMFISKKIIDNHGGRIEIQSEPERGTTVTVLLPVASPTHTR